MMIENLPLSVDEFEIYNYLNGCQCGKIIRVKVFKGDHITSNVYVEFANNEGLKKGLRLHNQLYKDKIIKVKLVDLLYNDDRNNIQSSII